MDNSKDVFLFYQLDLVNQFATKYFRILAWILTLHAQARVLRTIFRMFYGILYACINSGAQAVSRQLETAWERGYRVPCVIKFHF